MGERLACHNQTHAILLPRKQSLFEKSTVIGVNVHNYESVSGNTEECPLSVDGPPWNSLNTGWVAGSSEKRVGRGSF